MTSPFPKKEEKIPRSTFTHLNELQMGESTSTLLYGPSFGGKTFLAGTAGDRNLIITSKGSTTRSTLKSPYFQKKVGTNPIIVEISEPKDENDTSEFNETCDVVDYAFEKMLDQFDLLTLDEMTWFRKAAMWEGLKTMQADLGTKKLKKLTDAGREYFIPNPGDYRGEMSLIDWWIATHIDICRKFNKHLLIIAHERHIYKKGGNQDDKMAPDVLDKVKPGFTGKTHPDDVTKYFDNVFYIECVGHDKDSNSLHQLRTVGDKIYTIGTRFGGVFKPVEPNPNFAELLKRMQGVKKGDLSITT